MGNTITRSSDEQLLEDFLFVFSDDDKQLQSTVFPSLLLENHFYSTTITENKLSTKNNNLNTVLVVNAGTRFSDKNIESLLTAASCKFGLILVNGAVRNLITTEVSANWYILQYKFKNGVCYSKDSEKEKLNEWLKQKSTKKFDSSVSVNDNSCQSEQKDLIEKLLKSIPQNNLSIMEKCMLMAIESGIKEGLSQEDRENKFKELNSNYQHFLKSVEKEGPREFMFEVLNNDYCTTQETTAVSLQDPNSEKESGQTALVDQPKEEEYNPIRDNINENYLQENNNTKDATTASYYTTGIIKDVSISSVVDSSKKVFIRKETNNDTNNTCLKSDMCLDYGTTELFSSFSL